MYNLINISHSDSRTQNIISIAKNLMNHNEESIKLFIIALLIGTVTISESRL